MKTTFIKCLKFTIVLFIFSFIFGVLSGWLYPELSNFFIGILQEIFSKFSGIKDLALAWAIFTNNFLAILSVYVLGILFSLYPVIFIAGNAFSAGLVFFEFARQGKVALFIFGVAPHGIFELPAIFLGTACGLQNGISLVSFIVNKNKENFYGELKYTFNILVSFVIPLLGIAALIETFITPQAILK